MSLECYLHQIKKFYDFIIQYIEDEKNNDEEIDLNDFNQIQIKDILFLLSKIAKNHHRNRFFFTKIEKIILFWRDKIIQNVSNDDLFNIFKNNKRMILFLINNQFICINETIINYMKKKDKNFYYLHYFYPEIESLIDDEEKKKIKEEILSIDENIFNYFDEKRKQGENDSYLCDLIRSDNIVDFVSYVSRKNYSLESTIKLSMFETNSILIKNETSLIEYASFFGSIQIFKFLILNNVKLESSLWNYSIHSLNSEMIHILEENDIKPDTNCLFESIKCHHNDIAKYIEDNVLNDTKIEINKNNFHSNVASYIFNNYNYYFIPEKIDDYCIFFYLCKYDYFEIVKLYLNSYELDLDETLSEELIYIKIF